MNSITIGNRIDNGAPVKLDVQKLILTRLLVLANSGGGKSWLIRLIVEQLFPQMPVFIIDPEGEFSTLREKFDFVLVGKGGETPADCRSAKLVMQRLLELRASAIFDISELSTDQRAPNNRHEFVKLISEAALDSPKNLWRPTAFIFDEVQTFCPENGKGESIAKGAVIGFPTRGRKRQFLSIFATQRSAKLAMDARAEFLNRIIGMTFEPDDLKIAASILGISGREETKEFNLKMRTMAEGNFYGFGRALSLETILFKSGDIQTTHGVGRSRKYSMKAPPTPDAIKALLPKLDDLPKQAEDAANTERALRDEVKGLKAQLREAKAAQPPAPKPVKSVSIEKQPILSKMDEKRLVRLVAVTGGLMAGQRRIIEMQEKLAPQAAEAADLLAKLRESVAAGTKNLPARPQPSAPAALPRRETPPAPSIPSAPRRSEPPAPSSASGGPVSQDFQPDKCQRAIVAVLSQFPDGCSMAKIALLARYSISGGFRNALAGLRVAGMITGENTGTMKLTEAGYLIPVGAQPLPKGDALIEFWKTHPAFQACHRAIIGVLSLDLDSPTGMTMDQIAGACTPSYAVSGGFRNALSDLRTAGVIVGKNTEKMYLNPEMF